MWEGAFQDVVTRHAAAAGIDGRYRFTSMRDGFICTAIHASMSAVDLARHAGFRALAGVQRRQTQELLLADNVTRLLGL